jgi:hypothetical protein
LREFLQSWGVRVRQSSAYYPQSNGRAEAAVKSMKRLLSSNIGADGTLNSNAAARALLLQRNTPMHDSDLSPSEILYGQPIRDHLPRIDMVRREWRDISKTREREFAKRTLQNSLSYDKSASRAKRSLSIGEPVAVQDSIHGRRWWQQTGVVVEAKPDIRQYLVRVDGSNRITRRNRRHLRPINEGSSNVPVTVGADKLLTDTEGKHGQCIIESGAIPVPIAVPSEEEAIPLPMALQDQGQSAVPGDNVAPLRRSVRVRKPVVKLDL